MATDWTEEIIQGEHAVPMRVRIHGKRLASGASPLVLYLHGGAFTGGSSETDRALPTLLAETGAVVVSADYPLAPAHQFPDALHATFGALGVLHQCSSKWATRKSAIFVAGDEAGGNLAASLALMARDQQLRLAGQILVSPMLDPSMGTCSIRRAEAGPVGCKWADGWHQYLGSPENAAHPYAAPLSSTRLAGLAPALVLTAEDDPMRDESRRYAQRLREAGVTVQHDVLDAPTGWPGALSRPASVTEPWAAAVRKQFVSFFALTAAPRRSIPAFHPVPG